MTTPIPNIPAISTKATPAEIKRAFDSLRAYFAQLQTVNASAQRSGGGSGGSGGDGGLPGDDGGSVPDMTIPPAVTGFVATGAFNSIILEWDTPRYSNHAYTEIHRAETDNLGIAVFIGTTPAALYADIPPDSRLSVAYYYWARNVSTSGVKGPFQATNGAEAHTADEPGYLLELLTGEITSGQLFLELSSRIDLIDAPVTGLVTAINEANALLDETKNQLDLTKNQLNETKDQLDETNLWLDGLVAQVAGAMYVQGTAPIPGVAGVLDPIPEYAKWYDSSDGNRPYIWIDSGSGFSWHDMSDGRVGQNAAEITQLDSRLDTAESGITGHATALSVLDTTVVSHGNTLASHSSSLLQLNADLATAEGAITGNASSISSLSSRVTSTEGSITSQASSITSLNASVGQKARVFKQNEAPWISFYPSPGDPPVAAITKAVSGTVFTPDNQPATLYVPTTVSTIHSLTTNGAVNPQIAVGETKTVRLSLYIKEGAATYQPYFVLAAKDATNGVVSYGPLMTYNTTTKIAAFPAPANGWSAPTAQVIDVGGGWNKVTLTVTYTQQGTATQLSSSFQIKSGTGAQTYAGDGVTGVYLDSPAFFVGETADTLGDLWFDSDDNNRVYRWNGSAWIESTDTRTAANSSAVSALDSRVTVAEGSIVAQAASIVSLDSRLDDAEGDIGGNASALTSLTSRVTSAEGSITSQSSSITSLNTSVGQRARVFPQDTAPTASAVGDLWIETDNGNKLWRWSGSAWTSAQDTSKNRTFFQASAPTASAVGDIWFDSDDSNRQYRWTGSAWTEVTDPRTGANSSAISALDSRVTTAEGSITAQASSITELDSRLDDAEGDIGGQATTLSALNSRVTSAEGSITSQASSITSLNASVGQKARVFKQNEAPWISFYPSPGDPSVTAITKAVSGTVFTPDNQPATLYVPTTVSTIHSLTTNGAVNPPIAAGETKTVQLSLYIKEGAATYQPYFVVAAKDATNGVVSYGPLMTYNTTTKITALPAPANGWSAPTAQVIDVGGGWNKVTLTVTYTQQGTATQLSSSFQIKSGTGAQTYAGDGVTGVYLDSPAFFVGETADTIGDLWFDSDDNNRSYRWNGSSWGEVTDTRTAANSSAISALDSRVTTAEGSITAHAASIVSLDSRIDDAEGDIGGNSTALSSLDSRVTSAEGSITSHSTSITNLTSSVGQKAKVFAQDTAPTASGAGDLWIETDNSNKLWRWSGSAWTSAQDGSKNRTFFQAAAPTATATGDVWFDSDDSNRQYRWNGSSWGEVTDARTGANSSAISALDSRVTTAEGSITAHASSITQLDSRLDAAEGDIGGSATALNTLTTTVTTVQASAATDDAFALGFNPTFSEWSGSNPDGYSKLGTFAVSKETTIKRIGEQSIKCVIAPGLTGYQSLNKLANFSTAPAALDTFVAGTIDIYIGAYTSGGQPGVKIRMYTSDAVAWPIAIDTNAVADTSIIGTWQRIPFTARVAAGQQIFGIQVFLLPSCTESGFGSANFIGTVYYDNLRFSFLDSSRDALRRADDAKVAATAVANAAQATANTAVTNAATAQTAANTANGLLADIANDGKLTASEKSSVRGEWDIISAEKAGINSQATTFGITTENTAYNTKFQALANYLNAGVAWSTGIPSWINDANLPATTNITGSTFRTTWKEYYDARTALLNVIAVKAKTLADTAQSAATAAQGTANTAVANAATAQTAANTANGLLADIASDGKLTALEKQQTKVAWDGIVAEKPGIDAQADIYAITAEKTAYGTAYTTLDTYLNSGATPLLASLTTTSNITGATFRANFSSYYSARQALLDKIAVVAKAALFNTSFATHLDWRFRNTTSNWTVPAAGSLTNQANAILVTNVTGNSYFMSPAISIAGAQQTKVRARIRHIAGAGLWRGRLYWKTAGHGYTASYYKDVSNANGLTSWHIVEWDLTTPTVGGTDWINNSITGIRLDFTTGGVGEVWEVDWIAIGEHGFNSVSESTIAGIQSITTASAESVSQLQARLDTGDYAAVKTESSTSANSIGEIIGKYSVKVDVNGYVAGYGLIATNNNGTPTSEFGVLADKFWICSPGVPTRIPFVVFNGITYMDVAMIRDATITSAKIQSLAADKITTGYLAAVRIQAGSLTADKLAANSITAAQIAADAITASEIAANAVTATEIAANAITAAKIAAGNITTDTINGNAVTVAVNSYIAGSIDFKNATNTVVASTAITLTYATPILVMSDFLITADAADGDGGIVGSATVRIYRDGTLLRTRPHVVDNAGGIPSSIVFNDTPGIGTFTYYVTGLCTSLPSIQHVVV